MFLSYFLLRFGGIDNYQAHKKTGVGLDNV